MPWECDTNNYVGHSSVTITTNTINKDDYYNIYNLIETVSVKSKELGVNVFWESHGLKGALVSDGSIKKLKLGQWLKTGYK